MSTKLAEQMTLNMNDVITYIQLDNILPNPYQPPSRIEIPDKEAEEWYLSLERSGLIHFPIVRVNPDNPETYQCGDGWKRRGGYLYGWKKKKNGKYAQLPCVVKELSDQQMADLSLEANLQRRDFNAIELAWLYKKYLDDFGVTQEEFASGRGIGQGEVSNTIRLLDLPGDIQEKIVSGELSRTHGRQLLRLNDKPKKQQKMLELCLNQNWSVDSLDIQIDSEIYRESKNLNPKDSYYRYPPAFDIADCRKCPYAEKLTSYGNNKELRCLDARCWNDKQQVALAIRDKKLIEKLAAKGIERLYGYGDLSYNQYNVLRSDFLKANPDCGKCAHRAALRHSYDSEVDIVCIDPECFEKKQKSELEQDKQKRQAEIEEQRRLITDAIDGMKDIRVGLVEIIIHMAESDLDDIARSLSIEIPAEEADNEEEFDLENAVRSRLMELSAEDIVRQILRYLFLESFSRPEDAVLERLRGPAPSPAETTNVTIEDSIIMDDIKKNAEEYARAEWKQKAAEAVMHKSVKCTSCREKHQINFKLDPDEATDYHWVGSCPKCGEKQSLKNTRWDSLYGLNKQDGKEEIEAVP